VRSLSKRAVLGLVSVCAFFALTIVAVGFVGIAGVRSTTNVGDSIVSDELATASITAGVGRAMDAAHTEGDEIDLSSDRAQVARLERTLYDVTLPSVEADLAELERLHANDAPPERADLRQFAAEWAVARNLLTPDQSGLRSAAQARELDKAFGPVSDHINLLLSRESSDAEAGQDQASHTLTSTRWAIIAAVLLAIAAAFFIAQAGVRRIRRAVEPENDQIEFAEALQVADSEQEAHQLLKDHLERAIPHAEATVLNRNNSADRLEAMTNLSAGSCLAEPLQHAVPRSCLAVRSGRTHSYDGTRAPLLGCAVCGKCPGRSTCTPFTVSGEVIGAVLVTRPAAAGEMDSERIRESVAQAAPALANLRNLAIAELRAATDSLTGLPNKRAVDDTLKRMLAHASRSITQLAMLVIDLDHFKAINDQLGHPVGDQALANVGAALTSALRASDFAGRNGGEEFVVLLPDTDVDGALATAEKIRLAVAAIELPTSDVTLTASLGLAMYPDHATTAERLERLADAALYTAKRSGRNRVETAALVQDAVTSDPVVTTAP
jgi:diguanylate cyclase (GGDEF)-like protein